MAKVCCSIETEPRTLSGGQLNHAREVAAEVIQKLEPNEASAMFIEGMAPIASVQEMEHVMIHEEIDQQQFAIVEMKKEAQLVYETPCQCLCATPNSTGTEDHQEKIREPLSAPF